MSTANDSTSQHASGRFRRRVLVLGMVTIGLVLVLLGWRFFSWDNRPPSLLAAIAAQERPVAPSLEGGVAWINTEKPLQLEDLKGRIVLLDFWTLCCINCIHTLPDLAKLEAKYPGVLVVIGVHSPKFPNEKKTESILKAVLRYQIEHPVVNDANMAIWDRYGCRSWPTLVLIDPEGKVVGFASGEGNYDILDKVIGKLVNQYKAKKMLKTDLLPFQLARLKEPPGAGPLYFPGKVLTDVPGNRLFIADSTHHRIVITDLEGKRIAVAGTGKEGKEDGPFDKANFSDPQGLALSGDILYVADRKNHLIRALDLKKQTVKTIAGIGEQDRTRNRTGPALKTGLNSPWDLLVDGRRLFIAMAGNHQIWTLDLDRDLIGPYAGSGAEDIADGPLAEAELAQPSGLATDGTGHLYVADSETSSIRVLPMNGKGEVKTIVGQGLFQFGDVDGEGDKVRLQHALGVAYRDGKLYVADTYNSKLKLLDPKTRTCTTIKLNRPKDEKGPVLNEPGGLSFAGDRLYIADTNSHRIRVVDMKTLNISTLPLQGVEAPPHFKKQPRVIESK